MDSTKRSWEDEKDIALSACRRSYEKQIEEIKVTESKRRASLKTDVKTLSEKLMSLEMEKQKGIEAEEMEALKLSFENERKACKQELYEQKVHFDNEISLLNEMLSVKENQLKQAEDTARFITLSEDVSIKKCDEVSGLIEENALLKSQIIELKNDVQEEKKRTADAALVPDSIMRDISALSNSVNQLSRGNIPGDNQRETIDVDELFSKEGLRTTSEFEERICAKLKAVDCVIYEMEKERNAALDKVSSSLLDRVNFHDAIQKLRRKHIDSVTKLCNRASALSVALRNERESCHLLRTGFENTEKALCAKVKSLTSKVKELESKATTRDYRSVGFQTDPSSKTEVRQNAVESRVDSLEQIVREKDERIRQLQAHMDEYASQTKTLSKDLYLRLKDNLETQQAMIKLNEQDVSLMKKATSPNKEHAVAEISEESFKIVDKDTSELVSFSDIGIVSNTELLMEQKEEAEIELEFLREELKEQKLMFEKESRLHSKTSARLQDMEKKVAIQREEIKDLKADLEKRPDQKATNARINSLKSAVANVTEDITRKNTLIKSMRDEQITLNEELKSAKDQLGKTMDSVSRLEGQLLVKTRYVKDIKQKLSSAESLVHPLEAELSAAQSDLKDRDVKLKNCKKEVLAKECYIKTLKTKLENESEKHSQIKNEEALSEKLKAQVKQLKSDLERKASANTQLKTKVTSLEEQVEEFSKVQLTKAKRIEKTIQDNQGLSKVVLELQKECELLDKRLSNYQQALTKAVEHLHNLVHERKISWHQEKENSESFSKDILNSAREISQKMLNISSEDFDYVMGSIDPGKYCCLSPSFRYECNKASSPNSPTLTASRNSQLDHLDIVTKL